MDLYLPRLGITLYHDRLSSVSTSIEWATRTQSARLQARETRDHAGRVRLRTLVFTAYGHHRVCDAHRVSALTWETVDHMLHSWIESHVLVHGWLSELRAAEGVAA
jgi:hypothetical protein